MATIPCPSCGLPRAADLFGKIACPLCGQLGAVPRAGEAEPEHDRPWVIPEEPSSLPLAPEIEDSRASLARSGRFLSGWVVGFLVGVSVGVGGVLSWPTVRDWLPEDEPAVVAAADEQPVAAIPPAGPEVAPSPRVVARRSEVTLPITPVADPPRVEPVPKQPVVVGPRPVPAPPNPFRPAAPRAERLDHPEVYAPFLQPGGTLVARGRVKRLIVGGLEQGAILDCSALEAEEVVVVGKIDGGSRLLVKAPGGKVRFLAPVVGGSQIDVRAPGGTVAFETPTDGGREGSRIDGGAVVDLLAAKVSFRGRIAGEGTKVSVTLTAGGALGFAEIEGPARLEYGKADPDDPALTVVPGKVRGPAVVRKVEH